MFTNGTTWIRADFHLHTKADKEFFYKGAEDRFVSNYVEKLKEEEIKLGVITNHNKFDLSEYKGIQKKAKKEGITILPGVELSVKEGSNGIHCLIVFKNEDWIKGQQEYINQFLDEVFKNIENRENENTRCNTDLIGTIDSLNSFNKDYFILMAHIENKSGFYNECKGGLISSLAKNHKFREKVLGFQKGRTRDTVAQLKEWMGYSVPYIEGSDCKSIEGIGKGEHSYIKIGDNTFDSVIQAFKDFENRITLQKKVFTHGYIKSIEFKGGKMDNQKVKFSPELNCLIGIRGSGKSSVIEAIRYALNMDPSNSDELYKTNVVENVLDSGGQVILTVQDNYQKEYKVKRILGESQHIVNHLGQHSGAQIQSILNSPLYFGQKDLSSMDSGYELKLLNKLVGIMLKEFTVKIDKNSNELSKQVKKLLDSEQQINNIADSKEELKDIRHKIGIFEEKGISRKLSKQVVFQQDKDNIDAIIESIGRFKSSIESLLTTKSILDLERYKLITSVESPELIEKVTNEINKILEVKNTLVKINNLLSGNYNQIGIYSEELIKRIAEYEEEFAEIKREIDIPNLNPDDFTTLKSNEKRINDSINTAKEIKNDKVKVSNHIRSLSEERNQLLLEEFNAYKEEIKKININQDSLQISIDFKGNKEYFFNKIKESFRGANIKEDVYRKISNEFPDFVSLLIDVLLDNSDKISGMLTDTQLSKVKEKIKKHHNDYLKIITPNSIEIKYHGKAIEKHSIGQRASALVLFILSQKDNNLIMIDQPEDDLDNQVIYNEIIREVKSRKPEVQFIFATHNANIPVLGDSEQVIAVSYDENNINIDTGSIDNKDIQSKIVDIMEGGEEAFNKRKEIYNLWTK